MSQPPPPFSGSSSSSDPSTIQTQCPHCGQPYSVTPEQMAAMAGRMFPCSKCGKAFTLSADATGGAVSAYPPNVNQGPISYDSTGPGTKSNPLAIASLITGVLLCIPIFPAIAAIICGALGMKRAKDPNVGGKGMAVAGLTLGIVGLLGWVAYGLLMVSILVPSLSRARETAQRVQCASNMRQIGMAILLYTNENRGEYPPKLEDLLLTQDINSLVFVCPSTNDTAAPGATGPAQAPNLSTGGHLSYVYVGAGLTNSTSAETIILYEPMTNHGGDGMNVLYGDGHVEFQTQAEAARLITELNAGHNPPRRLNETNQANPPNATVEQ